MLAESIIRQVHRPTRPLARAALVGNIATKEHLDVHLVLQDTGRTRNSAIAKPVQRALFQELTRQSANFAHVGSTQGRQLRRAPCARAVSTFHNFTKHALRVVMMVTP